MDGSWVVWSRDRIGDLDYEVCDDRADALSSAYCMEYGDRLDSFVCVEQPGGAMLPKAELTEYFRARSAREQSEALRRIQAFRERPNPVGVLEIRCPTGEWSREEFRDEGTLQRDMAEAIEQFGPERVRRT